MGKGARNRALRREALEKALDELPRDVKRAIELKTEIEMKRQALLWANEFDLGQLGSACLILYNQHKFGPRRLLDFCDGFMSAYMQFREEYLMNNPEDYEWYAVRKLKEKTGIDLREWMDDWDRRHADGDI